VLWSAFCLGACASRPTGAASPANPHVGQPRAHLLRLAETGSAAAERCLGIAWRDGIGVPVSEERAIEWLGRAAAHGDVVARAELASLYLDDPGRMSHDRVSIEKVGAWLREAADLGDPNALARLAFAYSSRSLEGKCDDAMLQRLRSEAVAGNALACYALAAVIRRRGVLHTEEMVMWCRLAASLGNVGAQCDLASLLADRHEPAEAIQWYRRVAELAFEAPLGMAVDGPNPEAIGAAALQVGTMLAGKENVEAARWLQVAADYGKTEASRIEDKLVLGECPAGQSLEEWLRKEAESGNPEAAARLGEILLEKESLQERESEAEADKGREWLRKAATAGSSRAQYALAVLLGPDGSREAKALLEKAARQGHLGAATLLGEVRYREGDEGAAREWWLLAAGRGSGHSETAARARYRLGEVARARGEPSVARFWFAWAALSHCAPDPYVELARSLQGDRAPDWELILVLYTRAAVWNHLGAMQALERIYREGLGTAKNDAEAQCWAERVRAAKGETGSVWEPLPGLEGG
jgi:TPR repeat protein